MAHLIINERVKSLECQAQALLIRKEQQPPLTIPLRRLDTLVLLHSVSIPSRLISTAQEMGIALVYINTHRLSRSFTIAPPGSNLAQRKLRQLLLLNQTHQRTELVRYWINVKMNRMLKAVDGCMQRRPEFRKPLFDAHQQIMTCRQALNNQQTIDQLRGLEGRAQHSWFRAFRCLVPASLGFQKRQRRPAKDPVNALLSLTYTRVYLLVWEVILASGLDPSVGFYHKSTPSRQALACDVMEPVRPLAELFVMQRFNQRMLRAHDFVLSGQGCFLKPEALQRFQSEFEQESRSWKRLLRIYANTLIKRMEAVEYHGG
ncbi:CRISPR-associated endonuclease Cas1 [Endozoicomonas euniceicola]|uniref:CRISPR-associated endonuclease Cas1 n=1 Tax=Endozoicomonas euniceicola TaxID=1234143 RepID=A0ABY6GSA3_9GAMM|nr:CRISPR-associated endonuclease Cas1 [Endozoicomonas euniceicola]UYM15642.1 CRISPR-associated endonuclease Cas1 [Endozoicomonas euniceicola]